MTALTYFVAPMRCPECGGVSPADTTTSMSNQLSAEPAGEVLRVGDRADFVEADFESTFLPLRKPAAGEPIHVLHEWWCPSCGKQNWAEVVFDKGVVDSITAVPFDREAVARAHYIGEGILEYYQSVTGKSGYPNHEGRHRQLIDELLSDAKAGGKS